MKEGIFAVDIINHMETQNCFVQKNTPESPEFLCRAAAGFGIGMIALSPYRPIAIGERIIMYIHRQATAIAATLAGALVFSASAMADQQAFHRAYSGQAGDHLYTTSVAEIANAAAAGYVYEGVACNLVTANDPLAAGALYRAYSPGQGDHFYTANFNELINAINFMGYSYEGVAGFVTTTGSDFLRAYSGSQGDHLYTKNFQEWINAAVNQGYTLEGSAGKVL